MILRYFSYRSSETAQYLHSPSPGVKTWVSEAFLLPSSVPTQLLLISPSAPICFCLTLCPSPSIYCFGGIVLLGVQLSFWKLSSLFQGHTPEEILRKCLLLFLQPHPGCHRDSQLSRGRYEVKNHPEIPAMFQCSEPQVQLAL